jgi:hypothetical protein
MAAQHASTVDAHSDGDFAEHEKTYRMFIGLIKYGSIICILGLVLLAITTL